MKLNQLNTQEVLGILQRGLVSGEMFALNKVFRARLHQLANITTGLLFRNASEYEACTYVISDATSAFGVVVKVVSRDLRRLTNGLSREFALLAELPAARSELFRTPVGIALFALRDMFISVTELLEGDYLTAICVTEADVRSVAYAIKDVQRATSNTGIGRTLIANARYPYYAQKVHRFINSVLADRHAEPIEENFDFATLERARRVESVVVSDRSPANFIMGKDRDVGMFDFGLLLVGVPYEDWSWFIDDPRLRTNLTRDELVAIFIESAAERHRADAEKMFHWAAMFANIKQYCLMTRRKPSVAEHYLSRLRQSAEVLSVDEVLRLVEKLQL